MTKPTGRPPGRPRKNDVTRTDGAYANVFLSVGNGRDRSSQTRANIGNRTLSSVELDAIYESDGFARRIVDTPADDMVRAGFEIEGIEDDDAVEAELEALELELKLSTALRWAGLYGGSMMVLIVNDGQTLDQPLNEERVQSVEDIRVYDRWELSRQRKYDDPADKRFGKTMIWQVSPSDGIPYIVHESRCIVLDGAPVPNRTRERNDGWGGSKLQQCYDQLIRMNMSHVWANALLERAQQAVHGIPGLTNILRAPGGEAMVRQRIDLVDMARGINNTVVTDAEETYDLKSTSLTGVSDLIDRLAGALSAVTSMPRSLLFGEAPKGMNNNGQSDLENWYAYIEQQQRTRIVHAVDRIVGLVLRSMGKYTEDYKLEFCPLWMPSKKETADTDYVIAQTREKYVAMGALDPSEVRKTLDEEGYDIDNVDLMPETPEVPDGEEDSVQPA